MKVWEIIVEDGNKRHQDEPLTSDDGVSNSLCWTMYYTSHENRIHVLTVTRSPDIAFFAES
jgi:hypothetical protein